MSQPGRSARAPLSRDMSIIWSGLIGFVLQLAGSTTGRDAMTAQSGSPPPRTRLVLGLMIFAAVATPIYWVIWFFVDRSWLASGNTAEYFAYENSFPIADGWMTLCAAVGAWGLWRRRGSALIWIAAAGSSSFYLAGMDVLFDLENGIYRAPTGDWGTVITEVLINILTGGGGLYVVLWVLRERRYFATLDSAERG